MERSGEDGKVAFTVQLTDEAIYALAEVKPDAVYRRIGEMLKVLASFPRYGEEYDPHYEAARPPVPCRVLFIAHYGVYYAIDEEARMVTVLAIEDSRRDPRGRFEMRG